MAKQHTAHVESPSATERQAPVLTESTDLDALMAAILGETQPDSTRRRPDRHPHTQRAPESSRNVASAVAASPGDKRSPLTRASKRFASSLNADYLSAVDQLDFALAQFDEEQRLPDDNLQREPLPPSAPVPSKGAQAAETRRSPTSPSVAYAGIAILVVGLSTIGALSWRTTPPEHAAAADRALPAAAPLASRPEASLVSVAPSATSRAGRGTEQPVAASPGASDGERRAAARTTSAPAPTRAQASAAPTRETFSAPTKETTPLLPAVVSPAPASTAPANQPTQDESKDTAAGRLPQPAIDISFGAIDTAVPLPVPVTSTGSAPPAPTVDGPDPGAKPVAPVRTLPRLVSSIRPEYPTILLYARVGGTVRVTFTIAKNGQVTDAQAQTGPAQLRELAVAAVQQWRYEPATQDGAPIDAVSSVSIVFDPNRRR